MTELEEWLRDRLEELGVKTSEEELRELATTYPALQAWIRMVEELTAEKADEEA